MQYQVGCSIIQTIEEIENLNQITRELVSGCSHYFSILEMVLNDAGIKTDFRIIIETDNSHPLLISSILGVNSSQEIVYAEIHFPNNTQHYIVLYIGIGSLYFFKYPTNSSAHQIYHSHNSGSIPLLDFLNIEKSFYIESFIQWINQNLK